MHSTDSARLRQIPSRSPSKARPEVRHASHVLRSPPSRRLAGSPLAFARRRSTNPVAVVDVVHAERCPGCRGQEVGRVPTCDATASRTSRTRSPATMRNRGEVVGTGVGLLGSRSSWRVWTRLSAPCCVGPLKGSREVVVMPTFKTFLYMLAVERAI